MTERSDGPLFASVAGVPEPERPVKYSGVLCPGEVLGAVHRGVGKHPPRRFCKPERAHIAAGHVGHGLVWAFPGLTD